MCKILLLGLILSSKERVLFIISRKWIKLSSFCISSSAYLFCTRRRFNNVRSFISKCNYTPKYGIIYIEKVQPNNIMRHGLRYKPNSDWNERKEREGFVCSSNTTRIPIDVEYCVAVKRDEFGVSIRNTKDPYDTTLTFNRDEWLAFITGVKNGEFELL